MTGLKGIAKNLPILKKLMDEVLTYGEGVLITRKRKWYNPMIFFKGEIYHKVIPQKTFYK